ncbi:Uncharacterized membrane protein HdeD, DUF308 family [Nakamurella panacisegetis]|uniref:Uncharacterized membrane protein HdeD, DUF308 family n=1 Tax=Nakamurella panacisegetis TaxID=1090615 RepID=A0A1H0S1I2_9ACTN|nr:DUF308 domain-containing protein [Nakamurella panacisegetis]SDP35477.1 Uncharacterized membrane protein HdeD, DUF308 family [Nakamurella panacisegetis]
MSNSLGSDPLASRPLGGRLLGRSYSSSHLLVLGSLDIVAGLIALVWPGITVLALALIFGLMLLMAGLAAIAVGSAVRRSGGSPAFTWVVGAIAVIAGLICIFHPGAGVWAIILGCSLWFVMTGVADLFVAAASPANRLWFGTLGVLSIVAAVVLLVSPAAAIVTVALIAGIGFLVRGVGELMLGWRMRRPTR